MLCEVAGLQIVDEVVEWSDNWVREEMRPSNVAWGIKFGVKRYG